MPYMNSITDETGIDIEVVVTEMPGETVGMMECTEEIKVGEFYGDTSVRACDQARCAPGAERLWLESIGRAK
jgi:hypothetical protein